jgi:hypothetical protein
MLRIFPSMMTNNQRTIELLQTISPSPLIVGRHSLAWGDVNCSAGALRPR